jgi:dTMP kinase
VLLDRDPSVHDAAPVTGGIVDTWQVQRTLTEMAAADPGRYVRVDGDGDPEVVSARVREVLAPLVARTLPTSTV